ncbi:hypothetical protein [Pseudoalteromonas arabiensis]|uniref:hypothetical protein n=1 Tax=Pseudoalteromonas arabiensis TaxID=874454 RepID=UPI000783C691|nr:MULTISPECIES: hypothetical protein [Gammaproteobacteria]|tara:strand:+ start:1222 stop:1566 length:345 start_codon:yes stop_codon:yes gene_type:complete
MSEQPHAGLSLVNKAPLGFVLSVLVAVITSLVFTQLTLNTLFYALVGGVVCSLLLLAYWSGKGGIFFIFGVLTPLALVVISPLATMAALLYLLSGFFSGFWLLLLGYKLMVKKA